MNIQSIINIALTLVSKKDEIMSIIADALALWRRIQSAVPGLSKQLEEIVKTPTEASPPATVYDTKWLQGALNKLVDAKLTPDGTYGEATRAAVKKFQETYGLSPDGWAGVQTQAAILDALKSAG